MQNNSCVPLHAPAPDHTDGLREAKRPGRWDRRFSAKAALFFTVLTAVLGCGPVVGYPLGPVTTTAGNPQAYQYLTGNWQFTTTDANGQTFSAMAGYLYEDTTSTNGMHDASSLLQAVPGSCYEGAAVIPSTGSLTKTALVLNSFSVNGQDLGMNLTEDATATHLNGTYKVFGGCGNEDTGTVAGVRYAPVDGTYMGQGSPGQELSLTLTQSTSPDGFGGFPVSGNAVFKGVSCFTTGTVQTSASSVLGSAFIIQITAADGAAVSLRGAFDTAASTLTLASATITGDSCAATLSVTSLQTS